MTRSHVDDHRWRGRAACRDQSPGWFTGPAGPTETRAALGVCRGCDVRAACLRTALAHDPTADVGIWGGTTADQRRQLRTGQATAEARPAPTRAAAHAGSRARPGPTRPAAPRVTVARDPHGDFTDLTGRVIIARLPTSPGRRREYMLLIDGHPVARTRRLTDAQEHAWHHLHQPYGNRHPTSDNRTRVTHSHRR